MFERIGLEVRPRALDFLNCPLASPIYDRFFRVSLRIGALEILARLCLRAANRREANASADTDLSLERIL